MTDKSWSVKDALSKGASEDKLVEDLHRQIKEAKAEIAKENAAAAAKKKVDLDKVKKTREAAIRACYDYMVALGLVTDEFTETDFKEVSEYVSDMEKYIAGYWKIEDFLKSYFEDDRGKNKSDKIKTDLYADEVDRIIDKFLDSLE